jgi:hypothetical protein
MFAQPNVPHSHSLDVQRADQTEIYGHLIPFLLRE